MKKLVIVFLLAVAPIFSFAQGGAGLSNYPVSQITFQNNGTAVSPVNGSVTINYVSGCTTSVSGSVASITCTGSGGSGTVSANSGTAGELGMYAAASGSTTIGPDAGLISGGTGTLQLGAVGVGTGSLVLKGTTSGTATLACGSGTCPLVTLSSSLQLNGAGNIVLTGHLDQSAASQSMGSCSMSGTATCTFSINASYTTGLCVASQSGTGAATPIAAECSVSGTTVTITAPAGTTAVFTAITFGNPT